MTSINERREAARAFRGFLIGAALSAAFWAGVIITAVTR